MKDKMFIIRRAIPPLCILSMFLPMIMPHVGLDAYGGYAHLVSPAVYCFTEAFHWAGSSPEYGFFFAMLLLDGCALAIWTILSFKEHAKAGVVGIIASILHLAVSALMTMLAIAMSTSFNIGMALYIILAILAVIVAIQQLRAARSSK